MIQRQEVEQELTNKLADSESARERLTDQLTTAQRQLSGLQMEKYDAEKSASQLEKDKTVLIMTLDKVAVCR